MRFNLFGVRISFSFYSLALVTFGMFTASEGNRLIPICLLSAVAHELGHIAIMCIVSSAPKSITVNINEVQIVTDNSGVSLKQEAIIVLAGPVVNISIYFLCYLLFLLSQLKLFYDVALCNICLGCFNLLPVRSLDGGRLLEMLLSSRFPLVLCDRITNILSLLIIIPVATLGFFVLIKSRYNFSLLFVAIYLVSVLLSKEMR